VKSKVIIQKKMLFQFLQANESLGMAMIFNLAAAIKEWLDDNNISKSELEKQRIAKEEEEKEVA
jgi:hypothetical protein